MIASQNHIVLISPEIFKYKVVFYFLPWRQAPGSNWQYPASLMVSTPRFLAAQRSAVSSRREEVAFVALIAQQNKRVATLLISRGF